ncbi:MAG TPA: lamin tail domain-containing protein [Pyrinomonadaceae bacterium]|nr:lamin tail domain-containing protein [Pyrinomonadaceae bacterium]
MRLISPLHTTRSIRALVAKLNNVPAFISLLALFSVSFIAISFIAWPSSALTNNGSITTVESPLTENFDTLASTGTGLVWADNTTIAGWYSSRVTYNTGTGSSNTGALYSFGVAGTNPVTDRALGSVGSGGTGTILYGVRFVNNTGNTITSLDINYNGEQWRTGGSSTATPSVAQTAEFEYQVANAGVITAINTPATGWLAHDPLDFTSPIFGTTVGAALDGNAAANRTAKSSTIALTLLPGQEVWLRWRDIDHANNDHGLAVDDLSVTAHGGGGTNISAGDATVTEGDSGTTTASFTVSLSAPAGPGGVTFDISTQDNTATTADNDYIAKTLLAQTIPENQTSYTFDVTVNGDMTFEPGETFFVNVTNVTGATINDGQGVGTINNDDCPPAPGDVVISQVYGGGGNAGAPLQSDFIELFNQGVTPVNLSGWSVQYQSAAGTGAWQVTPLTGTIAPGGYYLVKEADGTGCSGLPCGVALPAADATGTIAMAAGAGKVALSSSATPLSGSCVSCMVDLVGYGSTASCFEGAGPTGATSNTTGALRKRGGCFDSDNNNIDFSVSAPSPRNTASPANSCTAISLNIHDIQGSGATTPYSGQFVSTSGIVTARKTNGFFLQNSEVNYDMDPTTSEGIFVFTSSSPAVAVGDAVGVLGTATEFFNLTQLESTLPGDVTVTTSGNTLPAPVVLTTTILNPAGAPDQLEPLEGMRLHADTLVSVAPTNEFGETFTVLQGVARPLREPGIEISLPVPPDPTTGVPDCCIPRFDENPERIMIDSDGLVGSTVVSVTSNVTLSNVTGPLDFAFGDYKVLPETTPSKSANMSAVPVPTPAAGEFTIAGYNIENFNNNATQRQKAALAIRDVLHLPDVIGTIEIFELSGLQALAAEIESISGVHYEARLVEADGTAGDADQDVGFLVKTSRVQIDSVTQIEKAGCNGQPANCNTFTDPDGNPALLNDRPPLVLEATVNAGTLNPRKVFVVVNHTRSFIDIELVGGDGPRVRAKRKAQGEFLADLLQDLQTGNPGVPVLSIGDYNAYQFNDGYTDPIATVKGTPTADDQMVVDASPDLVNPNFINLTDSLPADQRYSFIFEGTPQAIDHFLVNTVAASYLQRYHIARNNADFPEVPGSLFANDATRPERNSDHDMPVGYFKFPAAATTTTVSDASAVFSPTAQTVVLSANVTTAAGAVNEGTVTFTVRNASNAVVGSPVAGNVSGGVATANYMLPGGTTPQALTITGEFSGGTLIAPSSDTATLSVSFNICLLYDPTKAVKSGAVYPIKIQLCDVNGSNVSSTAVVVHAVNVQQVSNSASGDVITSGSSNADSDFRFDNGSYILNLKTTGLGTGTYKLYFTAGADPVQHSVEFQVK